MAFTKHELDVRYAVLGYDEVEKMDAFIRARRRREGCHRLRKDPPDWQQPPIAPTALASPAATNKDPINDLFEPGAESDDDLLDASKTVMEAFVEGSSEATHTILQPPGVQYTDNSGPPEQLPSCKQSQSGGSKRKRQDDSQDDPSTKRIRTISPL